MKGRSHIQGDTTHSPPRMSPSLATPLIICLSFIVLNHFFANMCVKKNCASPTESLTARHWSLRGVGACPPIDCLCPPISVYSEYVFVALRNDNTTGNNGKRNNNVHTLILG